MTDTFQSHGHLEHHGKVYRIARLSALKERGFDVDRLPFALRILLENLLRREDGETVPATDIEALAGWQPGRGREEEIAFMPARVLLQDFTGVPAVVDLAAMRDAMASMGGDPQAINPLQPAELVIDHSVQVDAYARADALARNAEIEFARNRERYLFLRWGQSAFQNFRVVPPNTGIVHQVNLEYLGRVVMTGEQGGDTWAYPDTLVGTDSHTTMINGLGVLGWGVGGIEAEAAMLGQPVSMLIPEVVGFRLKGRLAEGATATDLVLTVTQKLRAHGVVGKFVEFHGDGLEHLTLADRATIANMAPEYGATCGIFPVDRETIEYLRFSGREPDAVDLVEAYMREQGLFHTKDTPPAIYSDVLELDLGTVEPSMAGPKRPQDRLSLSQVGPSFEKAVSEHQALRRTSDPKTDSVARMEGEGPAQAAVAVAHHGAAESVPVEIHGRTHDLRQGAVVIAAITSCTNTSNPSVMVAAGLVARKANALGLRVAPWVKTSLAPGSKVVTDYLVEANLMTDLEEQGFHVVGYGCTTCIGNSGPLLPAIQAGIDAGDLVVASVLSGNRNFEGRVHASVQANYLASPPLVVAYALAGRVDFDPRTEPLGQGTHGPVYLKDVWPTQAEIVEQVRRCVSPAQFRERYANVFEGPDAWRRLDVPHGDTYEWEPNSTYVKSPPYFAGMSREVPEVTDVKGARCLVYVRDSITTDHISPAGSIKPDSPAGRYLQEHGIEPEDFNSYGSRRGNHEVMMRGTFANVRLKNRLTPGVEGSSTLHFPSLEPMSIYDAAMRYKKEGVSTIVIAGKEYGTGSSRDWAAKGPALLGVRAVLAESYERIHRSNLVGMGILPLEFLPGENANDLGMGGREVFDIEGITTLFEDGFRPRGTVRVTARREIGDPIVFEARVRIDTPNEAHYYRHGGILQYVLRRLLG